MKETSETWIVGAEYEAALLDKLGRALLSLGYENDAELHGVAGSQELREWIARGPRGKLQIVAETYIGLSVTGPPDLVEELRREFGEVAGKR
ncbi:MAG: hypothetical protein QNI99_08950 [Woeseiaceae bacterium]|nr:hypothetical protein [Woeseiaceae bacterium]